MPRLIIPDDQDNVVLSIEGKEVRLTNLRKIFWPELGLTKGDLLRYYATVAPLILPVVADRPLVMKRFPNGVTGPNARLKLLFQSNVNRPVLSPRSFEPVGALTMRSET